jgi:hypothetical protein
VREKSVWGRYISKGKRNGYGGFISYHVRRDVLGEAARDKSAAGVRTREERIGAAGSVMPPAIRHVVDGAVDGEEERLFRVAAVVRLEVLVGVFLGAALGRGIELDHCFARLLLV